MIWTNCNIGFFFTQLAAMVLAAIVLAASPGYGEDGWRKLPLIRDGALDPAWVFLGYGKMSVDGDALRTDASAAGLGLAVYSAEKFGDCELKIVYGTQEAKSNSGIYIRIDDGILKQVGKNHAAGQRTADGQLTPASMQEFQKASDQDIGPWYAVHHGFEVQICEAADEFHRSGSIYSLASAKAAPAKPAKSATAKPATAQPGSPSPSTTWREMIIRLQGTKVSVSIDGQPVSQYDSANTQVPERKQWYEPRREPVRPNAGYIGLQTHDPGDVVFFKEVSVRKIGK